MNQDGSIELFHYWNRLRDGRRAPRQSEIEPAHIKSFLGYIFILDRDATGNVVFRLAGSRAAAIFGRELKGAAFGSLWSQSDQKLVGSVVDGVFATGGVVSLTFDGETAGKRFNSFEMVVMPLDGGKGKTRILGALLPIQRPYWLEADPIVSANLTTVRLVDSNKIPPRRTQMNAPALVPEELATGERNSELKSGRRIRHLVVFDGGLRG